MRTRANLYLVLLVLCALLVPTYVAIRFAGRWLDVDAARLTRASRGVNDEGRLVPTTWAYPFGFVYPALNAFLAQVGGASVETLQTLVQPYLIALLVPIAFVAFRALTENTGIALLATLMLCLQPEFVFEAVRSSHGKVTYALALGTLYVLGRSLAASARTFARWVILFYILAFGLIASNSFFASSYVFGIAFAFVGGLVLQWRRTGAGSQRTSRLRRLLYTALSCSLLLFMFQFYLYPPGTQQVFFFKTSLQRLAGFFLDLEVTASPYAYVGSTWPSTGVYVLLTMFNWAILLLSFVVWCAQGWKLLWRGEQTSTVPAFLWLLYTAFAALLAGAVVLDLGRVLSANLQVRIFPHLMLVAIPLSATGVSWGIRNLGRRGPATRWAVAISLAACVTFFSAACLIKVTNDPLVSNKWGFHSYAEGTSVSWIRDHVRYASVGIGLDDRVYPLAVTYTDWPVISLRSLWGAADPSTRYYLVSDITEAWRARPGLSLPDVDADMQLYDSGQVQLYYTRPKTPYQR